MRAEPDMVCLNGMTGRVEVTKGLSRSVTSLTDLKRIRLLPREFSTVTVCDRIG